MKDIRYQALFAPQPEGGYSVTFPDIPEAITEGDSMEAATFAASESLTLALECMLEAGEPIPPGREHTGGVWIVPCASIQAAVALRLARLAQGKSVSDVARALHTSWPAAQRLESPRANPTLRQLERAAAAMGRRLCLALEPA